MTPKEKAKELVKSFRPFAHSMVLVHDGWMTKTNADEELKNAKECALIAVDEILSLPSYTFVNNGYWQHVKDEIEQL